MENANAAARQPAYECSICGYVYDPAVGDPEHGIAAGTPFEELPSDWVCPVCGASRDMFNKAEITASPAQPSKHIVKEYKNKDIIVYWYPDKCAHAATCWRELPEVFDTKKRPWVNVSGSSAEAIIRTIDKCPTNALQYSLPEGSSVDPSIAKGPGSKDYKIDFSQSGTIRVVNEGPLLVQGPNRIYDSKGNLMAEADRFVLCRCGKTKNPPFCDGGHIPGLNH